MQNVEKINEKHYKIQNLGVPTRMHDISKDDVYVEDCTSIRISWQCGKKIMTYCMSH